MVIKADPIQLQLRELRLAAKLTQENVAHMAGITTNTVWRMENGAHHSSIFYINLYLEALGKKLKIVGINDCQ